MQNPIIFWFRQDLRAYDLPGLAKALNSGQPVIPCYIYDPEAAGDWAPGGASRWWLHHSLMSLASDLEALGAQLCLRSGHTQTELQALCEETSASAIYCSRQLEPWATAQEQALHDHFNAADITFKRYPGSLLFEPEAIRTGGGTPFKVFSPFWRACLAQPEPAQPLALPEGTWHSAANSLELDTLALLPTKPDWAKGWHELWSPGSDGARQRLGVFLDEALYNYGEGRNLPAHNFTSRLSPHIQFGEISPREIWHAAKASEAAGADSGEVRKFLSELGWREFSHHLLAMDPHIPEQPFKPNFANFPWLGNAEHLLAWQRGQTGYPLVDAGMRELWQTGYMHNRVRMITASFLTKHLLIHWRSGEDWFWDTLCDASLATNSCSWQWVAGSGADAAPYFRIFNPTAQGKKFDTEGDYIRKWVPELAGLPKKYIQEPWTAPADVLESAEVRLGENYPEPIVDHAAARQGALDAYAAIKAS
ncbi:MAG: deoxyribodipyrimidine photo-lyase [Pseudomonadota bacterium]